MFADRSHAGEMLAMKLQLDRVVLKNAVVIGITRGGAVVAKTIAKALNIPFDIIVIKKLGAPENPELAMGAVGPGDTFYLDHQMIESMDIPTKQIAHAIAAKQEEVARLEHYFRGTRKPRSLHKKNVILVDDGVATGATVLCAIDSIRLQKPKEIFLAVPVIESGVAHLLSYEVENLITLHTTDNFRAVGEFYDLFPQVQDEDVKNLLKK